jgi:hypothetical protein
MPSSATLVAQNTAAAQDPAATTPASTPETGAAPEAAEAPVTLFPHSQSSRWWASGQINTIFQAHPEFTAPYSGENSLPAGGTSKSSRVMTLFLGAELTKNFEVLTSVESSGGRGIGDALGLAGFTNLDVVRNPDLGTAPYLARLIVHATLPLSREMTDSERDPLQGLATKKPVRRLELRAGKFSTVDFFDANNVGSDSHLQFMNWTVDNNGAYDYAADTRGYTWGAIAEYQDRRWGVRFGELLMPTVANGQNLDWALRRAHAENYELELRPSLLSGRATTLRVLAYRNTANMGDYRAAVERYRAGLDPRPIIENTRQQGTVKYGFGLNGEQEIAKNLRGFFRLGWNEGRHESFAYTEVNATAELGADLAGGGWHRKQDKLGLALVTNGISRDHQLYLKLGGLGFLLGDGNLNYGRENIVEFYYTAHLWRGFFSSFDLQRIVNPGYNRDRGPVLVPAVRLHLDL